MSAEAANRKPANSRTANRAEHGLFRTLQVTDQFQLQVRAEAFNATNTPHFANPNGNVNSSNFGRVLATQTAHALGRSREFRFGVRLSF